MTLRGKVEIANGTVDCSVASFGELDDYVGQNCYGGMCDADADPADLDAWIKVRRKTLMLSVTNHLYDSTELTDTEWDFFHAMCDRHDVIVVRSFQRAWAQAVALDLRFALPDLSDSYCLQFVLKGINDLS